MRINREYFAMLPYGCHQRPPMYDFITPSRRTLPLLPRFRALLLWDGSAPDSGGGRASEMPYLTGFEEMFL